LRRFEADTSANAEAHFADGIGRRLVRVFAGSSHGTIYAFVNWQTGALIASRALSARTAESLDTATGRQTICRPVRVGLSRDRGDFYEVSFRRVPVRYAYPWTVRLSGEKVVLQRCGRSSSVVLARGIHRIPWLTKTFVAWRRERTLYAQRLGSRDVNRWPISRDTTIATTGTRLFASTLNGSPAWYVEP
jgi:hypothetical protein